MRILITGGSGLLGSKVVELAVKSGHEVFSGYHSHISKEESAIGLDVRNERQVFKVIKNINPDALINCAALTDVDKCEVEKKLAYQVNFQGSKLIAEACKKINTYLVFISTDYVFDGSKGMYCEEDKAEPINYYGYSKLLGEKAVAEVNGEHLIVRPSVIYGSEPASGKTNFALWLLNSLKSGKEVKVLTDQYVSPTLNINLAEMLLECCKRKLTGLYHMAGVARTSRFDFAVKLAEVFNMNMDLIKEAQVSEMPWRARRPRDSSLDVSKVSAILKAKPINLREALNILRREIDDASRNKR